MPQHHAAFEVCAKAGAATGEWAFALRDVFGEYRAGLGRVVRNDSCRLDDIGADVDRLSRKLGRRLTLGD